jgi:hypothetical protein
MSSDGCKENRVFLEMGPWYRFPRIWMSSGECRPKVAMTASRAGQVNVVPLEMALQAAKENRHIVYATGHYWDNPDV